MCLGAFLFGFILYGILWVSWTWVVISFPILGNFSTLISSNIFSYSFSLHFGTPIIQMLVHLILSQRSLRLSSILFIFFFSSILLYGSYWGVPGGSLWVASPVNLLISPEVPQLPPRGAGALLPAPKGAQATPSAKLLPPVTTEWKGSPRGFP